MNDEETTEETKSQSFHRRQRGALEILARWIVDAVDDPLKPYQRKDHACVECVPGEDMVISGFECGQHLAQRLVKMFKSNTYGLEPLDIHGIDDLDIYHPPSRARYLELMKERDRLEKQVTELQTRGTQLENERRMWNGRYTALRAMYETILLELPIAAIMKRFLGDDSLGERAFNEAMAKCQRVSIRADLLEKDAWTQVAPVARAFVEEANGVLEKDDGDAANAFFHFIDKWRARFATVLA